jgi:hypothetical protein
VDNCGRVDADAPHAAGPIMSCAQAVIEAKAVPPELDRWNWGAFLLGWIWGIGNNTYIALLALVPGLGLIMHGVLGAKGSTWAWQNGHWDSVAHFKRVQRAWAMWGVIVWLAGALVFASVFYVIRGSDDFQLGIAKVQASPVAASILGAPIKMGLTTGHVTTSTDGTGKATLHFSASGPKAAGTVDVEAIRKDSAWTITKLTLKPNGQDKEIDLLDAESKSP